MIFQVTFKDPDALWDALNDAIDQSDFAGLSDSEFEVVKEKRIESVKELVCDKWFEWGEYLTVEIDTEEETCVVVPNK